MATFEGTFNEFYTFLGPRTSNLVTEISRKHRKGKSCKQTKEDNNRCGKWRYLDAAHKKGNERKIIIKKILDTNYVKVETKAVKPENIIYKIDLDKFEEAFKKVHTDDFFNVIEFMCRKHHKAYDSKNNIESNEDDYKLEESNNVIETDIDYTTHSRIIKKKLINAINFLNDNNCSIAKISNHNWNFNLNVNNAVKDYNLVCVNQLDKTFTVITFDGELAIDKLLKKSNKNKISLNIPYTYDDKFFENKTGYEFKIKENYIIE